jgi:Fe(3+) dicitrate transport protein
MNIIKLVITFTVLLSATSNSAQVESSVDVKDLLVEDNTDMNDENSIYVIGSKEKAFYTPGSAHFINQKELKQFDYTDIGRVLDKVPGVYIQEEDGLGLRPNIGLRGAHPHRSRKVTLMEDGLLIGPAPYSAPAAYYFPSTSRTSSVEVYKGPSSVRYGPNSIGGAINMVTKPISQKNVTEVDFSTGLLNKLEITTSNTKGNFGYLIQATRKQGDLVRQISNQNDLTFSQDDILAKFKFNLTRDGSKKQSILVKTSYSTEDSSETYLGTSQKDFNEDPYLRYEASRNDQMEWKRIAASIHYNIQMSANLKTDLTLYHNDFQRNWFKFNKLNGLSTTALGQILAQDSSQSITDLLNGKRDSVSDSEQLVFGGNDRKYYSQGIEFKQKLSFNTGANIFHDLSYGLRLHRDQIERNHTEVNAVMKNGTISYLDETERLGSQIKDVSNSTALFLQDEINLGKLTALIGSRIEYTNTKRDTRVIGEKEQRNSTTTVVPGVGFNYSVTDNVVMLAGINRGITMTGPGQADDIAPEESINYEAGIRVKAPIYLEAIGFYSDYSNIKGTCSFSSGCSEADIDREYNGGEAEVFGLETTASHTIESGSLSIPLSFGYTYTVARFTSNTESDNADWGRGLIESGDPLPYIPQGQAHFRFGLAYKKLNTDFNILWKDKLADQSVSAGRKIIPSYVVTDFNLSYSYNNSGKVYFRIDNLFDKQYVTSLRPLGLRPGKPRAYTVGLKHVF